MKEVMSFEKFKSIMEVLIEFQGQRDRISDFLEKELCDSSYCICTVGSDVENTLVCLLADEFNCWYSFREKRDVYDWWTDRKHYDMENEIESWLYGLSDEPKAITLIRDGKEENIDVNSLESFYDYLVKEYCNK